jgi:hypothetical protein
MILEISNQIQQAVIIEIANEYSGKYIGSQFEFNKLFLQGRVLEVAFGKRTVVASRLGVGNIFGSNAHFEFQDQSRWQY